LGNRFKKIKYGYSKPAKHPVIEPQGFIIWQKYQAQNDNIGHFEALISAGDKDHLYPLKN